MSSRRERLRDWLIIATFALHWLAIIGMMVESWREARALEEYWRRQMEAYGDEE